MKKNIFTTSIYRSRNYNPSYDEIILNELEKQKKINQGSTKSNVGGFQSYDIADEKILKESSAMLTTHLANYLSYLQNEMQVLKVRLANCWINENYKFSYNKTHVHPDTSFSAVYYIKTNANCGDIEFYNENSVVNFMNNYNEYFPDSSDFHSQFSITPVQNDLIIFPSYLKHGVTQNLSDDPRVSIAFNLQLFKNE